MTERGKRMIEKEKRMTERKEKEKTTYKCGHPE